MVRFDFRPIGHLLSDDGKRLTEDEVKASPILFKLCQEASGQFESALYRGGRYTFQDLGNLTDNGLEMVIGLVAGYAMWLVWERRPDRHANMELPMRARLAAEQLDALATGQRILPFQEAADAGRIHHDRETPQPVFARGLSAVLAFRYFGKRGNEYWPSNFTPTPHN